MKTAMQELAEWLETPNVWGENNFSVRSKVKQLLEKEKEQIISSFDMGKSRAYATADNECEVKFGFQFYAEIYNVQPGDDMQCGLGKK